MASSSSGLRRAGHTEAEALCIVPDARNAIGDDCVLALQLEVSGRSLSAGPSPSRSQANRRTPTLQSDVHDSAGQ